MRALLLLLMVALAGCSDGDVPAEAPEPVVPAEPAPPPVAPPALPVTGTCDLMITGYGTPPPGPTSLEGNTCAFTDAIPQDLSEYQTALVEVTWPELQETIISSMVASIQSDDCTMSDGCELARGSAARDPPIRLELDNTTFVEHRAAAITVYLLAEGAMVDQEVTVFVTLFEETVVPRGHSAIQ